MSLILMFLNSFLKVINFKIITNRITNARAGYLSTVTRLRGGRPGFDSWQGQGIFLFATASKLDLGPTQPPIQWVAGILSPGLKWPGREANHSPP
jgi:hypothetical protein